MAAFPFLCRKRELEPLAHLFAAVGSGLKLSANRRTILIHRAGNILANFPYKGKATVPITSHHSPVHINQGVVDAITLGVFNELRPGIGIRTTPAAGSTIEGHGLSGGVSSQARRGLRQPSRKLPQANR